MAGNKSEHPCCELCGQPLEDGEAVVQIVRDRHPTYDREIVLETFHESCHKKKSVERACGLCGCTSRITLFERGEHYQNLAHQLLCPFCGTLFDTEPGFED